MITTLTELAQRDQSEQEKLVKELKENKDSNEYFRKLSAHKEKFQEELYNIIIEDGK